MTVQYIHLADDEWGNTLMDEIAGAYVASYSGDKDKLVLEVYEHGGWWMIYAWIGGRLGRLRVVQSANDSARYDDDVKAFWKMYNLCEFKVLPTIRRQTSEVRAQDSVSP